MAYSKEQKSEIIDSICSDIEKGNSLRKILASKDMPIRKTFFSWIDSTKDDSVEEIEWKALKRNQYACACEARAELIFEDILHIADDTSRDTQTVDLDGIEIEQVNHEVINRSRLRVDARKWMLAKMMPKKFGDKVDLTSKGDKINSVPPEISVTINRTPKESESTGDTGI